MLPKISIFASAIRTQYWEEYLESLTHNDISYEVVFAGHNYPPFQNASHPFFFIKTDNIKPCQCYEIARRFCSGELVHWSCDDAVYEPNILDRAYEKWHSYGNPKLVLSIQTKEDGQFNAMHTHRLFANDKPTSPLVAPLGLMSRAYLSDLGGYDRNFTSGQGENDICLRVQEDGGVVEIMTEPHISIEHKKKHGTESRFFTGYHTDRKYLESCWVKEDGTISDKRLKPFEPFPLSIPPHYSIGDNWFGV